MPDITMCTSNKCELRKDCYRHEATPSLMQSYFVLPDDDVSENKDCEYFLSLAPKQEV